jgi:hypothetical protein
MLLAYVGVECLSDAPPIGPGEAQLERLRDVLTGGVKVSAEGDVQQSPLVVRCVLSG